MRGLLAVAGLVVAAPGVLAALHLGGLAVASWFYRVPGGRLGGPGGPVPRLRFRVIVPAHNEEPVIGATLAALSAALRPGDRLLVVADRCTDATGSIARGFGAEVLVRGPDRPVGRAAARQDGVDHALRADDWDAVLFVDADSVVDPGFLDACERALVAGAPAVQARSEAATGGGLVARSYLAAFALQGVTIPRGRDRLGLSVRLRGTGMALRRDVLGTHRFRAPASEDLFYSLDLCLDGVLPRHVESARLRSANVAGWRAASAQRVRYEAGRMAAARAFTGPLLRRAVGRRSGRVACVEAAVHLLTPPLALAVASVAGGAVLLGAAVAAGVGWAAPALAVPVGGLGLLVLAVVTGLVQARADRGTWLALLAAPWYVLFKLAVQLRALASLRRPGTEYGATPRE
ncbi:MAG TPA: glycosyltransferase family 2 protein [Mycobacteriales bacterium]|nr:glycosyltransferase family 2 protein [Mycobacteriales bacterium]